MLCRIYALLQFMLKYINALPYNFYPNLVAFGPNLFPLVLLISLPLTSIETIVCLDWKKKKE